MSRRSHNAREFLEGLQRIGAEYDGCYKNKIAQIRKKFVGDDLLNEAFDKELEVHTRAYFIDQFLECLNWFITSNDSKELPNIYPEASTYKISSAGEKRTIRLDYLGVDADRESAPLLVVEAKRTQEKLPSAPPNPRGEETTIQDLQKAILKSVTEEGGLIGKSDEWIKNLRDYVSIQRELF